MPAIFASAYGRFVALPTLLRVSFVDANHPLRRVGVVRLARDAVHADDRGDVHDRAGALLHHPAGHRAAGVEDRGKVRLDHVAPVLVRHPRQQPVTGQARVVDEDVELAGLLDQALGLVGVGDVGLDSPAARFLGDRLGLVGARAVADHDLGTAARELERDRPADAARAAGDEGSLPFERGEAVRQCPASPAASRAKPGRRPGSPSRCGRSSSVNRSGRCPDRPRRRPSRPGASAPAPPA